METMEIAKIKTQVELEMSNKETVATLAALTFKGLQPDVMKRAMIEGLMRGFTFKDFLEKNIYAIPYSGGYSLVTSIDNARKIGMRSGIVGKNAPVYVEQEGKIITCEVTVKKLVSGHVGDFTALVYYDEYHKAGKNGYPSLWESKPRTMIAKVAEMHALRMACPEEMSQNFIEEEITFEDKKVVHDMEAYTEKLQSVKDEAELKAVWSLLPIEVKTELTALKDEMKKKLTVVEVKVVEVVKAATVAPAADTSADDALLADLPFDMGGTKPDVK